MENDQLQSDDRKSLDDIAHEFSERCAAGESPSVDEYAKLYPDHASDILDLFPTLLDYAGAVVSTTSSSQTPAAPKPTLNANFLLSK